MLLSVMSEVMRKKGPMIKATVVLMRNFLDLKNLTSNLDGEVCEFFGKRISFQLVSATVGEPSDGYRGKMGKVGIIEGWNTYQPSMTVGESRFEVKFEWDDEFGIPGAVIVNNFHPTEFLLKTITLEDVPGKGRIHFDCNSWVYPQKKYNHNRVFFSNDTYTPSNTPLPLQPYREEELKHIRGEAVSGMLLEHHRVYDYDHYNDLGTPDFGDKFVRPILGGSKLPYPRRCRTSRKPTLTDSNSESRLPLHLSLSIYVPRDERFGHIKLADFIGNSIKGVVQGLLPGVKGLIEKNFNTFEEVLDLYYKGIDVPPNPALPQLLGMLGLGDQIPFELIRELVGTLPKLPVPQVIEADNNVWRTDEEFAREMLAGVNPVLIQRLREFPPTSNLDPAAYGNQTSSITEAHIISSLDGLSVKQALEKNKLYILDHHDSLMPYITRINEHTGNKIYATRTLLFLKEDGTLKPLAIELSLPHPDGEKCGAINKVHTPADTGIQKAIWQLAKAYVTVNDSGVHQLISHWLNTHAVIEPFVIATNRQLSVIHPIHKLMSPHFRDTMNINALARTTLINAGGVLELTVFPGKFALEMSAVVYKDWKLTDYALPTDLIKRGIAVEDTSKPHSHNLRLHIEDYPYAVDGLAIWSAITTWVTEYCSIYYPTDADVAADKELQAWWKEIREVGHGDLKDETWWPDMQTISSLTQTCATIIWIGSALHAAVNFGQYPYAGYLPNRPTVSRRLMPEPGSPEYELLKTNPDKVLLNTITGKFQTVLGVALIEILSRHSADEVYLGQRDTPEWTSDRKALEAFFRFRERLVEIEQGIMMLNGEESLKNRNGPVKVPYTLLYPNASDISRVGGLTGKGIPNSVSI